MALPADLKRPVRSEGRGKGCMMFGLQVGFSGARTLSENSSNVIDDDQWHMVSPLTFVTVSAFGGSQSEASSRRHRACQQSAGSASWQQSKSALPCAAAAGCTVWAARHPLQYMAASHACLSRPHLPFAQNPTTHRFTCIMFRPCPPPLLCLISKVHSTTGCRSQCLRIARAGEASSCTWMATSSDRPWRAALILVRT